MMDSDPVGFAGVFLRSADVLVELLEYGSGRPPARVPRDPMEHGLAHISFVVDDVDAAIARIEAHGGAFRTRLEHTFDHGPGSVLVFCTDPDGNRIELIQHADAAETTGHGGYLGLTGIGWPAGGRPAQL
jgi:catechol 2,3-dioxygenase-like lactoylglutathione lyase family enzyme